jgi:DNA 3'-phosphatase
MATDDLSIVVGALALACSFAAGCAPAETEDGVDDSFLADGKVDVEALSACETTGVLRLVNASDAESLRGDAGLTRRAAGNIVAWRAADDGAAGTDDDRLYASLAELDAVPYVGPVALERILDRAEELGWTTCPRIPAGRRLLDPSACPPGGGPIKVAFFDADSTLRVSQSGAVTANAIDDVYLLPFAADTIARLNAEGYLVAIVSNQLGVSRGFVTAAVAEGALLATAGRLALLQARIDYVDFAERADADRKPGTGMATRLGALLEQTCGAAIDLGASVVIGDSGYREGVDGPHPDGRPADDFSNADRLFAENLGVAFQEPTDAFGWRDFGVYNVADAAGLQAFLDAIEAEATRLAQTGEEPARRFALAEEAAAIRLVNGLQ